MFRSLKLGVNGEMYVARGNGTNYLGAINDPNNTGFACNYAHNGIYLNGLQGRWGLNNAIEDSLFCPLNTGIFEIFNKNSISLYFICYLQ